MYACSITYGDDDDDDASEIVQKKKTHAAAAAAATQLGHRPKHARESELIRCSLTLRRDLRSEKVLEQNMPGSSKIIAQFTSQQQQQQSPYLNLNVAYDGNYFYSRNACTSIVKHIMGYSYGNSIEPSRRNGNF